MEVLAEEVLHEHVVQVRDLVAGVAELDQALALAFEIVAVVLDEHVPAAPWAKSSVSDSV